MAVFYNQATLTYSGGTTNSHITTGELVEVLSATKTAVSAGYLPGDSIAYVISIVNAGAAVLSGLTISDDLGAYEFEGETLYPLAYVEDSLLYYVDGVLQTSPTVNAGPPLEISGINVPAGSNVMLIYEARITEFAPLGPDASISNTAAIDGDFAGSPVEARTAIGAAGQARLTISKSISPDVISGDEEVTYTFVIQNSGSEAATAEDQVVVTDLFEPILDNIQVTFNGAAWSEPANYTYDEATGQFSSVAGQITVPAATFEQNADGSFTTTPGVSVLTISGTL